MGCPPKNAVYFEEINNPKIKKKNETSMQNGGMSAPFVPRTTAARRCETADRGATSANCPLG
jgi:hypothetical protein